MLSKAVLKYINSLQIKKYRHLHQAFLVEGAKSVKELLQSDFSIEKLFVTEEFLRKSTEINFNNGTYELIDEKDLVKAGTLITNNAALAIVRMKPLDFFNPEKALFTLVLDDIRDPGNLGTIIRLADWYGLRTIFCSESCADFYNPKVIAATMGSFTRVQVVYVDLPEFLKNAPSNIPVFGASLHGQNIHQLTLEPVGMLVMGNEAHGIRPEVEKHVQELIQIPRFGGAESLNVANATGIILDNFFRNK
ncbi:TrmH family RNA methyltransferase [Adhaeribacter pallidiroseus]|uniref:rRNA methyltransferase 3, mitochondrial n=1 Tax=Adhaeribacter pallidiroseus TaxID=2072847 RepID=A0A369QLN8_9BACT|nr:RNA methyltransferase [Adhaeribacter pallidiroseus]RDC63168.1 rRNA methyltransferase 3, mitochondrial [Adhaeribacter pallidiroseus]